MHTRKSHRLKGWNYASDGAYFITIVTKNRIHLFGEVDQTEVVSNQ
jgi:putative transposase